MSNIISKIRQRIALKENNKFDLSCDHITTTDFFHINPVYIKEMVPNEKIKLNVQTFSRLTPLVRPMYGRCQIVNRAFFVPMRVIMKGWNEFITDTVKDGTFPVVPKINLQDLAVCLREDFATTGGATANSYDFCVINDNVTPTYYKFTAQGRRVWSLLQALGYRFPIGYYGANAPSSDAENPSALPLLAYAKIYYDWYKNQAYAADEWFNGLFDLSTSSDPRITRTRLGALLTVCSRAVYDKDYFTSAWDRPVAPNNNLSSANSIIDITNDATSAANRKSAVVNGTSATASTTTTPILRGADSSGNYVSYNAQGVSQYILDALKSLTDYMKRHQLAGGLAMDRMLARFGVKPSDAALSRSIYLGKDQVDVNIADVMSTANTENYDSGEGNALASYAGKGVGYSPNGFFQYDTDEYGFLMVISTLIPKVGYVQGMNRQVMHRNRLDFFTPEFDSLGVQAIARKELLSDYNNAETNLQSLGETALTGIFGYTSRYAEYKTAKDNLTGQFTIPSINSGMSTWHLNRMLPAPQVQMSDLTHDYNFVSATDSAQYDRVFAITDENASGYDHFINIYHFEIEDYAPMAKLFDDYEFDGGKKEVSIEVNGTQLN